MGLRDRIRVALHPDQARRELERWREENRDVRAPEGGEFVEYDPASDRWRPVPRKSP